ncbi:hypothetical protein, conserved [Leishmania tarentolae]|uniref:Peptidase C51 domain-containing protein n=1 Tax=Leishmania tarentolae TaxID=5689 RepID=A0A640KQZ1_LEITA|nr:hypothetical protein, conserved [Leishmania tarentolae]
MGHPFDATSPPVFYGSCARLAVLRECCSFSALFHWMAFALQRQFWSRRFQRVPCPLAQRIFHDDALVPFLSAPRALCSSLATLHFTYTCVPLFTISHRATSRMLKALYRCVCLLGRGRALPKVRWIPLFCWSILRLFVCFLPLPLLCLSSSLAFLCQGVCSALMTILRARRTTVSKGSPLSYPLPCSGLFICPFFLMRSVVFPLPVKNAKRHTPTAPLCTSTFFFVLSLLERRRGAMKSPPRDRGDGVNSNRGGSRSCPSKPRPSPLAFPQDRTYGTLSNDNDGDRGSSAGVGDTRQSGLLMAGSTNRRISNDSMPLWSYAASPIVQIRDHCHQQWLAVLLTAVLLLFTFYFVFGLSAPVRADRCANPFGSFLGKSRGVAAYSNCRNDYGGDNMEHFVSVGMQRLYTGSKWQALEYARRYWILTSLLTFPSLPRADHFILTEAANAVNKRRGGGGRSVVPLEKYTNLFLPPQVLQNRSEDMPVMKLNGEANNLSASRRLRNWRQALVQPNDIVVYAKNSRTLPSGHVAVVTSVRGPFHSVASAGKDVHWFIVKNVSAQGRQPMAPESTLPRWLLLKEHEAASGSTTPSKKAPGNGTARRSDSGGCEIMYAEDKDAEVVSGGSVLYYKVFVAEQNWDNSFWETMDYWRVSDGYKGVNNNPKSNGNGTSKESSAKGQRRDETRLRNYSRVLLLHEYSNPHGFFLEDTHNNIILGWVRASSDA